MKRLALALCLAALAAPALDAQDAPATSARRRVAVLDFDYGTVHSYVTDIWGSDVDIGKGIASMLLTELVQNGAYVVIERTQVDRILDEQNLQQEGRADASTAAKLGRLLGVDAIIIGSITQFGRDDKKLGVGGGKIGFHGIGRGGLDMSSSDFGSTILGEATRAAVTDLVTALAAAAPKILETIAAITALVADVTGSELIINIGTAGGVRIGTEYTVVRPGREIKDPATGSVLRRATTPVGKIKITSADQGSATGTLTGDAAHVGDCVGACPLAPAAGPPAQKEGPGPAPAPSTPSGEGVSALPAVNPGPVAGRFTWPGYSFTGTA